MVHWNSDWWCFDVLGWWIISIVNDSAVGKLKSCSEQKDTFFRRMSRSHQRCFLLSLLRDFLMAIQPRCWPSNNTIVMIVHRQALCYWSYEPELVSVASPFLMQWCVCVFVHESLCALNHYLLVVATHVNANTGPWLITRVQHQNGLLIVDNYASWLLIMTVHPW